MRNIDICDSKKCQVNLVLKFPFKPCLNVQMFVVNNSLVDMWSAFLWCRFINVPKTTLLQHTYFISSFTYVCFELKKKRKAPLKQTMVWPHNGLAFVISSNHLPSSMYYYWFIRDRELDRYVRLWVNLLIKLPPWVRLMTLDRNILW